MQRPLKRNLREQVVDAIGSDIVGGRLRPGQVLPTEETLLARYDVSRTVLREALHVLAGKGLVDSRQKRGTVVRARSEWSQLDPVVLAWRGDGTADLDDVGRSLQQLMEIRRIVEPAAAALAAKRGTATDFACMTDAYHAMERAGDAVEPFMEADLAFHVACLYASHNDFLLPVAHAIRTAMMASLSVTNADPKTNRLVSLPLHRAILDAVLARGAAAAAHAMERHLDDTERRRLRATRRRATARGQ